MSPSATASAAPPRLRALPAPPLRVADVALWYGERSGGIRTYLDAKAAHAAATGAFEHHVLVPGRRRRTRGTRHELRALSLAASNGYRLPLGTGALEQELIRIRPEVILAHDPFWALPAATAVAAELDAAVVAVHHASASLEAAALPGPQGVYLRTLERWRRRSYARVDAVMAADAGTPAGNRPLLPLRFGLDPAFVPQPSVERGDHVLYAGRISREKGIFDLLRAAAASREPWPIRIVGTGPARGAVEAAIRRNGLRRRVTIGPYVADRAELAREYARAACVVMPGRFETFGLVALEAAASGAGVVAAAGVPAAAACGELCETFEPDDADGLLRAIERARARTPDLLAAARIGAAHDWRRAIEAETEELRGLLR